MNANLRHLQRERNAAQMSLETAFKAAYPVGSAISWLRGNRRHAGRVINYAFGERLKVQNENTDNAYYIYMADVLRL